MNLEPQFPKNDETEAAKAQRPTVPHNTSDTSDTSTIAEMSEPIEQRFFNTANKKFDQVCIRLYNWIRKLIHSIPEASWHCFTHTLETVFGGFAIGFGLYLLQLTPDSQVNALMLYTREHFIEHYKTLPIDILNAGFIFLSSSLVLAPVIGKFLRRYFISPVFKASSHGVSLTTGMILAEALIETISSSRATENAAKAISVSLLLIFLSVMCLAVAHIAVHGISDLFKDRREPFKELKPQNSESYNLTLILLMLVGILLGSSAWKQLKINAAKHAAQHSSASSTQATDPQKSSVPINHK